MAMYAWRLILAVHRGHRYFVNEAPGPDANRVAVADDSGWYPHDTEDGVLWLDKSRVATVDGDGAINVPLLDQAGRASWTRESLHAAPDLVNKLGLTLELVVKHRNPPTRYFDMTFTELVELEVLP